MDILDTNLFDMYNANLTKLLNKNSYVSFHDAILTNVIEFNPGNEPDRKTGKCITFSCHFEMEQLKKLHNLFSFFRRFFIQNEQSVFWRRRSHTFRG